jgi:hypothetical protein
MPLSRAAGLGIVCAVARPTRAMNVTLANRTVRRVMDTLNPEIEFELRCGQQSLKLLK